MLNGGSSYSTLNREPFDDSHITAIISTQLALSCAMQDHSSEAQSLLDVSDWVMSSGPLARKHIVSANTSTHLLVGQACILSDGIKLSALDTELFGDCHCQTAFYSRRRPAALHVRQEDEGAEWIVLM